MSIKLEFISLIIPLTIVEKYYPGGLEAYKKDHESIFKPENYNVWFDDELVKEGAMNPWDMESKVKAWKACGVKTSSDGDKKWENVCVVDMFAGPTLPCDWLSVNNDDCTVSLKHEGEFNHLRWLCDFEAASERREGFRELRAQIFQDTVKYVQAGSYKVQDTVVELDNNALTSEYFIKPSLLDMASTGTTSFNVVNADCLETAKLLDDTGLTPCVLNMGSRQNPGGGVLKGAGAQEENLFRRTNIFYTLYQFTSYSDQYGIRKNSTYSYPLNRDTGGVYAGNVTVFRGSEKNGYCLLKRPYKTAIVTVPAINHPDLVKRHGEYFISDNLVEPSKEKIRTILRIAGKYKHDSLVLSAFGCGAFRNPPNHMALLFKEVFQEPEFLNKFKSVVFAIIDDHNSRKETNPHGNVLPFLGVFDGL
jgi:uncharacterized protein (TIGR02452 family)